MNKNFYITTPIYYVNDSPHIGHAYTTLACDVAARFKRLDGYNVRFLTGTDEHGQKVEKSAQKAGVDPQKFTDDVSMRFRKLADFMNFSHDDFIRTTEERHKIGAQEVWKRLEKNGHIYLDKYSGWYSVRDEAYYQEAELIDGKAPTGADVEWVEEESYFFKLSAFEDKLLKHYEDNPDFIVPKSRRNEVLSFVKGGLRDLSISRTTFSWGVPVPGNEKHVMYVWLDALTNYMTAVGFPDENADLYKNFWPADIHMVGKDILRFHAVYWPAFLMGAELPLPKKIVAHGWWTNEGQKISKSVGNIIDPIKLVDEFGLDQVRYFLMREVPFGNDGDYSRERMIERINADLANNIGNLAQRTLSMIYKNCDGKFPEKGDNKDDKILLDQVYGSLERLRALLDSQSYHEMLALIIELAGKANEFIDVQAPWKLKKEDPKRMGEVLYALAETIRVIAILLQPFIPESAGKMLDQLGVDKSERGFEFINENGMLKSGIDLEKPEGVFPRFVE
ncbi:methionine--tRNA ligase [Rickettsiales bacterium]|nr:methionine--tRNA ligase [Rickettsiales bacterium]